jgi:hypothetical protein
MCLLVSDMCLIFCSHVLCFMMCVCFRRVFFRSCRIFPYVVMTVFSNFCVIEFGALAPDFFILSFRLPYTKWVYNNWHLLLHISLLKFSKINIIKNDIHLAVSGLGTMMGTTGACLPLSLAPYLMQIRWIWTHFKRCFGLQMFAQNEASAFETQNQPYPFAIDPFADVQARTNANTTTDTEVCATPPALHPI